MGPLGVPFVHCHSQLCLTWREFLHFSERKRKAATKRGDEGLIPQPPGSEHAGQNKSRAEQKSDGKVRRKPCPWASLCWRSPEHPPCLLNPKFFISST